MTSRRSTGRHRTLTAATCVAAVIGLTGCAATSSAAPSTTSAPPPSISASPTTSLVTSATPGSTPLTDQAAAIVIPTGWKNVTPTKKPALLFLQAPTPTGGFFSSFSVGKQSGTPALSDTVNQGMIAMRQDGATVRKIADRTIGGAPASGYVAETMANGTKLAVTQYFMVHGSATYFTTMSSALTAQAAATATQDAVLNTWSWSGR